jgi:hypothetical protein
MLNKNQNRGTAIWTTIAASCLVGRISTPVHHRWKSQDDIDVSFNNDASSPEGIDGARGSRIDAYEISRIHYYGGVGFG